MIAMARLARRQSWSLQRVQLVVRALTCWFWFGESSWYFRPHRTDLFTEFLVHLAHFLSERQVLSVVSSEALNDRRTQVVERLLVQTGG